MAPKPLSTEVSSPDWPAHLSRLRPLREVARLLPGEMSDPNRWLTKQVLAGRFRARKVGRHWYMTDDDVCFMFEALSNVAPPDANAITHCAEATSSSMSSISASSQRRRQRGFTH
jgi:hypothetical protein